MIFLRETSPRLKVKEYSRYDLCGMCGEFETYRYPSLLIASFWGRYKRNTEPYGKLWQWMIFSFAYGFTSLIMHGCLSIHGYSF